jgi:uncharacterized membrane protein
MLPHRHPRIARQIARDVRVDATSPSARSLGLAHHVLLHFPVALSVLAAALHCVAAWRDDHVLRRFARFVVYLAALGAVIAVVTGLVSAGHVVEQGGDATAVVRHRNAALLAGALLLASGAASWFKPRSRAVPAIAAVLATTATGFCAPRRRDVASRDRSVGGRRTSPWADADEQGTSERA